MQLATYNQRTRLAQFFIKFKQKELLSDLGRYTKVEAGMMIAEYIERSKDK